MSSAADILRELHGMLESIKELERRVKNLEEFIPINHNRLEKLENTTKILVQQTKLDK